MFRIRNYQSDEVFDLGKLMDFVGDVYDVLDTPFLDKFKQLPTVDYYEVNKGSREIDVISMDVYGDPYFAFLLQFYNDCTDRETFPEDTILKLFDPSDVQKLYDDIVNGAI